MENKRPLVAVTAAKNEAGNRLLIHNGYMQMLLRHGVMPVLLPMVTDESLLEEIAEYFDGFVISGGGDIDSAIWGEPLHEKASGIDHERDAMEIALLRILHAKKTKPVLGVCRGAQAMNVAMGGSLYQDVPSQVSNPLNHSNREKEYEAAHEVEVFPGTLLSDIVGTGTLGVNTLHHQAVREVKDPMMISAIACDHVIEAIESCEHPFYIGVQWHPERLGEKDRGADALFESFCNACIENAR